MKAWVRFVLGAPLVQVSCAIMAAGSFAFAQFLDVGPNDPPKPLVAMILAIGCFPIIAVGMMRGQRARKDHGHTGTSGWWLALLLPLVALASVVALAIA